MAVISGQKFNWPSPRGRPMRLRVKAVRHHPVSFVEVEHVDGGRCFTLPLTQVEHLTRFLGQKPVENDDSEQRTAEPSRPVAV